MNTQRPEWNDANNALVGNGVSMVTLYYLRRFLAFFKGVLGNSTAKQFEVSMELSDFFKQISKTLIDYQHLLGNNITDRDRKTITDGLGKAGSRYRSSVYQNGFSSATKKITAADVQAFVGVALKYLEQSIAVNKRKDGLYHAYNLMTVKSDTEIEVSYLAEMLEGQVAVLSSGHIGNEEAVVLLDGLKNSALFRADQYSYILYPNKDLPKFVVKNNIPEPAIKTSVLLQKLLEAGDNSIIEKSADGGYHFNGDFNNADSLKTALASLPTATYGDLVNKEQQLLLDVFEAVFDHKSFTGRSGTFFGYEGLGSIYWHMVSKLLLAVQEICLRAIHERASDETIGRLLEHYYEINEGIGVHKSPELYGAFPTDPYSHTPAGKGAQQPGMTGQVKEDILSRFGELGVVVEEGIVSFIPHLLRKEEFLKKAVIFQYLDVHNSLQEIALEPNSLAFTYCQVPVVYRLGNLDTTTVFMNDNSRVVFDATSLDAITSKSLFLRDGTVTRIEVCLHK